MVLRYLAATGNVDILDTPAHFLEDRPLRADEESAYFEPTVTKRQASLYEHCALAIDATLAAGPHGLPLIGAGDWNDGMNRVGYLGRGESTWMAWFLCAVLPGFAQLAAERHDDSRAARWQEHCRQFAHAAETAAWDGAWYRRGYFDDGTPLGSATRPECRIDSLAQSWAVLSGAANPERAGLAMSSVSEYLVRPADDLVLLFTPPFDKSEPDPGYVRGYVPGVRENGGHYAHAAVWCLIADARLGRLQSAAETLDMLNPVHRSATRRKAHVYRVEPYVMAADISSEPPNTQRGGWTWYTGSAAWLYHAVLEEVLGLRFRAGTLEIQPALPPDWTSVEVRCRMQGYRYVVQLERQGAGCEVLDIRAEGQRVSGRTVSLLKDDAEHSIQVVLG
jgi:cyclic beta-1,2-glucan synthetase